VALFDSIVETVGGTPLVKLQHISDGTGATILGKLEAFNPCGSIKDRIGVAMIRAAEKEGILEPGDTIVEATSGNTGIALAFAAAALGYRLVITMPENMSRERIALLRAFGAEVELTRGGMMRDAVERAAEIVRENDGKYPKAISLNQFSNPANPEIHRRTTAREILDDTGGNIDVFIAGVGTGGTITGVGSVLKERVPRCHIVAVEPSASAVLSGKPPGPHGIQGIGPGFVPEILDRQVIDEVITIDDDDAAEWMEKLTSLEGIFAGLSSGAAIAAALTVAHRPDSRDKTIVVVLPDTGERYVSTLGERLA
jgi:cysteine synthase A